MCTSISLKACFLCLLALGFIHISYAQQANPSAHTHGLGNITVVYEAEQLLMELETPAANLLGFEQTPQSEAQWLQVKKLREALKTPYELLTLTPSCDLRRVEVDVPFEQETNTKDHNHEHDHSVHQDIRIDYEWLCKGQIPPSFKMHVFDRFPGFEKINVQWVSNGMQGAAILDKNNTVLNMTQ